MISKRIKKKRNALSYAHVLLLFEDD
jgi:hypothetical protein